MTEFETSKAQSVVPKQGRNLTWLPLFVSVTVYLIMVILTLIGFAQARAWAIDELSPQQNQAWAEWKSEVEQQDERGGPVERRPIVSESPPMLLLLRDSYWVCLLSSLAFGTLIYSVLNWLIWGVVRQSN